MTSISSLSPDGLGAAYSMVAETMRDFEVSIFRRMDAAALDPVKSAVENCFPDIDVVACRRRHSEDEISLVPIANYALVCVTPGDGSDCVYLEMPWKTLLTDTGRRSFNWDTEVIIYNFQLSLEAERTLIASETLDPEFKPLPEPSKESLVASLARDLHSGKMSFPDWAEAMEVLA
jgi:hypothetical protein